MNGKADTGSVNSTCASGAMPPVGSEGQSSPSVTCGDKRAPVSGDSAGHINASCSVPNVTSGKEGSPNNGNNPQHPAAGL